MVAKKEYSTEKVKSTGHQSNPVLSNFKASSVNEKLSQVFIWAVVSQVLASLRLHEPLLVLAPEFAFGVAPSLPPVANLVPRQICDNREHSTLQSQQMIKPQTSSRSAPPYCESVGCSQ